MRSRRQHTASPTRERALERQKRINKVRNRSKVKQAPDPERAARKKKLDTYWAGEAKWEKIQRRGFM